jgi:AcrR family transcriptional regulator
MVEAEIAEGPGTGAVKARRTQVERRAHTRASLIESAVACINAAGAASVSTAQIAAQAGVTRGAVQHHFGSPEDLYLAVVDHGWEAIARSCDAAPGQDVPVHQRIDAWAEAMVAGYTHPAARAGYELLTYHRGNAAFVAAHLPVTRAAERKLDHQWVTAFADTGIAEDALAGVRHTARTFVLGALARSLIVPGTDSDLRGEVGDLFRAFLPDRA